MSLPGGLAGHLALQGGGRHLLLAADRPDMFGAGRCCCGALIATATLDGRWFARTRETTRTGGQSTAEAPLEELLRPRSIGIHIALPAADHIPGVTNIPVPIYLAPGAPGPGLGPFGASMDCPGHQVYGPSGRAWAVPAPGPKAATPRPPDTTAC